MHIHTLTSVCKRNVRRAAIIVTRCTTTNATVHVYTDVLYTYIVYMHIHT